MVLTNCSVPFCKSKKSNGISLFEFPSDRSVRHEWLNSILEGMTLEHFQIGVNSGVCINHFQANCIEHFRDGRTRIKKGSVPTMFQQPVDAQTMHTTSRQRKFEITDWISTNAQIDQGNRTKDVSEELTNYGFSVMPGGTVCSVAGCKNNSKKARETGKKLSFFTFPKDYNIQKEWVRKCYHKGKWNCLNKRICSIHFTPDDFEDKLQARLLNIPAKILKKDAIPSLFLNKQEHPSYTSRSKRMKRRENKKIVEELLCSDITRMETGEKSTENIIDVPQIQSSTYESDVEVWKRRFEASEREKMILKQKIEDQEHQQKVLQARIFQLEEHLKEDSMKFEKKVKHAFKDFLTSNQIEIALKKKTKAHWTQEELSRAFTLRYFSKRSYMYLKETLHYPLPGLSTLQKWAANISLTNGVLEDVLFLMKTAGKTKNNCFRATVLSYQKVKVSSLFEYHQEDDEIMGPHSYVQVIMAKGLFDDWKQPVYIGFDQKLTKELLKNIITQLHGIEYHVVACTSDYGGGNQALWKSMGITIENTSTEHPVTKKSIYFFADVPSLLKSLRNWFIDTGFIIGDDVLINKDSLKNLLESTRTEIDSCRKLTQLHLNCEEAGRQDVELATQLFSNTTATALKYCSPDDDENATITADFFQLVNDWFDIMNSNASMSSIPTKKPFGLDLELQNEVLNTMLSTVSAMVCTGKRSLQTFQKGVIISIKSLQGLFASMRQEYNIKYLVTHRLYQDCLEKFFSQIRTHGGLHDQPSPSNAIYRVKMVLLAKNPELVTAHLNVQSSPGLQDKENLLASAMKQENHENIEIFLVQSTE